VGAGTLPASLAALPNLVVLRLAGNQLSGSLSEFAAALQHSANLTAGTTSTSSNKIFDLDLSWNQVSMSERCERGARPPGTPPRQPPLPSAPPLRPPGSGSCWTEGKNCWA
jgi:hypothetical protein